MTHNTTQLEKIATDFLAIVPEKRQKRAQAHLHTVLTSYTVGEIWNTEFKAAKEWFGYCVEEAYKAKTSPFRGDASYRFGCYLGHIMGLHSTISLHKKLAKLKPTTVLSQYDGATASDVDPAEIQAAQEVADAAQPLALLFKELKPLIVKGRKPNPEAIARRQAALDKKDLKTCACCFRTIARLQHGEGLIADHGFKLAGRGWGRQGSCYGADFRPLEISDDGLKFMVNGLKGQVENLTRSLETAPDRKSFQVKKNYWSDEKEEITPENPRFAGLLSNYVRELEANLKYTKRDLEKFEKLVAEWKPTHTPDGKLI